MSFENVRGLNGDSEKVIGELIKKYDRAPSLHTARLLSKRLIRRLYSLTMSRDDKWFDNIDSLVDKYGQGVKVFGKELKGIHQKIYHNHNLNLKGSCSRRDAVRAVISQNNKYLLIYSSQKGDYKFPGGGVEPGESFNQALEREVLEESGYRITEIGTQIALISEFSESREEELDYFQMDSHYFHCTIDLGEKLELNLDKYELDLNFEPLWISLEEAISANKKVMNGRAESPSWTERETFFLEYLTKSD